MTNVGGIAAERLTSFIERIERLKAEQAAIGADVREVFAEAKSTGFDVKTMREILRLRKMDTSDREAHDHLVALYRRAVGLDDQLDLFEEGEDDNDGRAEAPVGASDGDVRRAPEAGAEPA